MAGEYDVAIIGAGAAGLAAAGWLAGRGLSIVLLEARDRIGGRAHTILGEGGLPLDEGCGWLHSADENPLVAPIEAAGLTIDRTLPAWQRQSFDEGFSREDQAAFGRAFDAFEARLEAAAATGRDAPAADFLEPGGRWNALMNAVSAFYNGAEFDRVSLLDYDRYRDSGVNWRVREGYGAALARLALPLAELVLGCPVARVALEAGGVAVETPRGRLHARRAVLAVPTPHLAEGRLALPAECADEKAAAAAGLPLGLANKVFLALDAPEMLPADGHFFGRTDRTGTGSYHLRPFGRPYVECFLGGRHALSLEEAGEGAAAAFAIEELAALLGNDVRRRLRPLGETAWARDPHALGSYSHALPGHVEARGALARPAADRLFFAGEATHATAFSTAHGAWESGLRAADEALVSLGRI